MSDERLAAERRRIGTWGEINRDRWRAVLAHAGRRVLDAGCSSGAYVRELRKLGYEAYGVDRLVDRGWRGAGGFAVGDARALPFRDEAFDTALAFEVLEHLAEAERALAELRRVVRSGLIVSVPDAEIGPAFRESGLAPHHWIDRTHVRFFTEADLRGLLASGGFAVRSIIRINPIRPYLLALESYGVRGFARRALAAALDRLPRRPRYYLTLLAVADKT